MFQHISVRPANNTCLFPRCCFKRICPQTRNHHAREISLFHAFCRFRTDQRTWLHQARFPRRCQIGGRLPSRLCIGHHLCGYNSLFRATCHPSSTHYKHLHQHGSVFHIRWPYAETSIPRRWIRPPRSAFLFRVCIRPSIGQHRLSLGYRTDRGQG